MLKILQVRLQQYVNRELPNVQTGFRKGRGTRDQIANIHWIIEKAREFQKKHLLSDLSTAWKPLTVWITTNCGKFFKRWEYQTTLPASWETCMQIKKQQLEPDMEQRTGSKLGKEYVKAVCCPPCLFNFYAEYIMRNAGLHEAQAGIKIALRNISNLRNANDTTLMAESEEELMSLWMKVKEESENWLKTQHSKSEDHGIWSHHFMVNRWGNSDRLYFFGLQNPFRWWLQPWNQKTLAPWKKSSDKSRQHVEKQKHYFADKVHLIKAMVFPVVMYGCESCTIEKAECQRTDAFELWCWRMLLRVPWTARRSN